MSKEPDAIKIIQTRRMILGNLNRLYDSPLQVRTLRNVMIGFDEHYDLSLLKKDLMYLKQKGYIEFVDEKIGGFASFIDKYVGLTAKGKEIAEQTANDPALEI